LEIFNNGKILLPSAWTRQSSNLQGAVISSILLSCAHLLNLGMAIGILKRLSRERGRAE